jgi:hypothetical protein
MGDDGDISHFFPRHKNPPIEFHITRRNGAIFIVLRPHKKGKIKKPAIRSLVCRGVHSAARP